jgi:hypothetical protein
MYYMSRYGYIIILREIRAEKQLQYIIKTKIPHLQEQISDNGIF